MMKNNTVPYSNKYSGIYSYGEREALTHCVRLPGNKSGFPATKENSSSHPFGRTETTGYTKNDPEQSANTAKMSIIAI